MIQVQVNDHINSMNIYFVYGLHTILDRRSLWEELQKHERSCVGEWVAIGDFNCVFESEHRVNGRPVTEAETADSVNWMNGGGLGFVKSLGHYYSWSKKGTRIDRIYSRIDHCVANAKWLMKYDNVCVHYLNPSLSNHSPLLFQTQGTDESGGRPFRVFDHLLDHPAFPGIIEEEWGKPVSGKGFQLVYSKLDNIKRRLKNLHSIEYINVTTKITHFQSQVQQFQTTMKMNPLSQQLMEEEATSLSEWRRWLQVENRILRQKARIKWLSQGDDNINFFHACLKQRTANNRISCLVDDQN